ncbi:hypothetical protein ASD19_09750 [Microbacterium sp. Root53]|uniref:Panacea domain-containing protein n=1 Tax=Microbacterium sp. Root53 TaxID=1736553 RepID=UPI0006F75FFC|nr:type II toxin-antitoxin system antitoxin SocA domain-containing protein [Microbacterium sp. Root53]KQY96824.1 hypothetical protein ASD19_09750 [Microbacterium sp. Root53]
MIRAEDVPFTHHVDPMAVAAFFLRADQERVEPDITPLKLQKLLYLAQANYLASTGERLFDADVEAFDNGPVVDPVRRRFQGRQIIALDSRVSELESDLPADVAEFLARVWERYQDWSASKLWRLTHSQAPWKDNYVAGQMHTLIPDESMAHYFATAVPARDRILHPHVVVADASIFDEDPEADGRLREFLTA